MNITEQLQTDLENLLYLVEGSPEPPTWYEISQEILKMIRQIESSSDSQPRDPVRKPKPCCPHCHQELWWE